MASQQQATQTQRSASRAGVRPSKKAKACNPCRQQKLKCDALSNGEKQCSRCAATGIPCYFSAAFERSKARSKAEMQREILMLRSQLSNSHAAAAIATPSSQEFGQERRIASAASVTQPIIAPSNNELSSARSEPQLDTFEISAESMPAPTTRVIDGICVQGYKVKDCFSLFFKHYHPMLPVLDPSWDPDSFYKLSPFVFWCLLITGSRRYELDPTILDRLAPCVGRLSLEAMMQVTAYFPTICGLLILCTWPLPMSTTWEDPSPMYSGAAMQLALQHGLHLFTTPHASTRPAPFRGITKQASLARIWAYLEFVCHCTSWTTGTPPHYITDAFDLLSYDEEVTQSLPPSVFWMQEFEKICTRANMALTDLIQSHGLDSPKESLHSLIKIFDDQIINISRKAIRDLRSKNIGPTEGLRAGVPLLPNPMIISVTRVHVNAFHFFGTDRFVHFPELINLYHLACHWTDQASDMDEANNWAFYSSESYFRHMLLIATVILRISRNDQLKSSIDLRKGEKAYFTVVRLLKKRSLSTRDVNANTANILSELWNNDYCFRQRDGSNDSLSVPVSGRGVMAVAYDCLGSWRRETRQATPEPSNEPANETTSTLLSYGHGGNELMDTNFFPDLLNDTSMSFLYDTSDMQWSQDECFWA